MTSASRPRLPDKLIGPVMRRVIRRAGELALSRPTDWRVLMACLGLTVAWNRVADTVSLLQVMDLAGLCEGQGGRANTAGRRECRESLRTLADVDLIEIAEPRRRNGRWWIAVPDWALGQPVDNPAAGSAERTRAGTLTNPERTRAGTFAGAEGTRPAPLNVPGQVRSTYRRVPKEHPDARERARPPDDPAQRHLVFDPPAVADPDRDPFVQLLARLRETGDLDDVIELARSLDHPDVAAVPDDPDDGWDGLDRAVREVCEDLELLPGPARGVEAVHRLPGPWAAHVMTRGVELARDQVVTESHGMVRPLRGGADHPAIAIHLDDACDQALAELSSNPSQARQQILDRLSKGA